MSLGELFRHPFVVPVLISLLSVAAQLGVKGSKGYDTQAAIDQWRLRRNICVGAAGNCFSTGQCCDGLICAAFDDYFGQKPEVPGYCVREKDLQVCTASSDCDARSRCISLGRTGERYCLPKSEVKNIADVPLLRTAGKMSSLVQADLQADLAKLKGLGADCKTNADCKPLSDVTNTPLCCQNVRRGRQSMRRVCDRVIAISTCIV